MESCLFRKAGASGGAQREALPLLEALIQRTLKIKAKSKRSKASEDLVRGESSLPKEIIPDLSGTM